MGSPVLACHRDSDGGRIETREPKTRLTPPSLKRFYPTKHLGRAREGLPERKWPVLLVKRILEEHLV